MKTIAFLNKKGGAGKTTTAIGVAFGAVRVGLRVGLVDVDSNGSAGRWLETVDDLAMVACRSDELAQLIKGLDNDYDLLVVDTPPNDVKAITDVARLADLVVIPLAPTAIEVDQLADTVGLIEAAGSPWIVAPVRVRMSTLAGQTIEQLCTAQGIPVTRAKVPLSEAIARSFGEHPPALSYSALVDELLNQLELIPA